MEPDDDAKGDAAVYKGKSNPTNGTEEMGAESEDEDDGVLLNTPAQWNNLTLVVRDVGVLRFVKYVSKAAKGSRWDVTGTWQVEE